MSNPCRKTKIPGAGDTGDFLFPILEWKGLSPQARIIYRCLTMISNSYLLKALRGMSGKVLMCIIMVLGYMTAAGNLMWNTQKRIRGR